jgi:hypothetical protein
VGRNIGVLKETVKNLSKAEKEMGLTINLHKTKYMGETKKPTNLRMLKVDEQEFERVREFKYLVSTLTEDNNITIEIKLRIVMANRVSYGLKKQLSLRYLGGQTKCTLYKTLVRPILTYGSESWPLTRKDVNILRIFERRILRRIYDPVKENGIWRLRYNYDLCKLYSEPDIEVAGTPF